MVDIRGGQQHRRGLGRMGRGVAVGAGLTLAFGLVPAAAIGAPTAVATSSAAGPALSSRAAATVGKTAVFSGGFTLAGLNLSSAQTVKKATDFSIEPAGGFNQAAICGRNARPRDAAQLREIPWSARP